MKNHVAVIRQSVAALVDENNIYRREAGNLRLAGLVLIKYLERLAAGKLAGTIQQQEIKSAVDTIRKTKP